MAYSIADKQDTSCVLDTLNQLPARPGMMCVEPCLTNGGAIPWRHRLHLDILKYFSRIPLFLQNLHRFPEPERVDDFPFPQKFETILQIDIIRHIDQPLIRRARLLLSGDILVQVGDRITFY